MAFPRRFMWPDGCFLGEPLSRPALLDDAPYRELFPQARNPQAVMRLTRARIGTIARVVGINLLVLGALLLLAEVGATFYLDSQRGPWSFQIDPVTGHAHEAGDYRLSANAAEGVGSSRHFILKRYAGGSGGAGESDGEVLRLLALGGSTTDPLGEQFSGVDGTWVDHLGALLGAGSMTVEIANAGVAGFSSAQELLKLVSVLSFHHPDIVISLNGINEIYFEQNRLLADDDNILVSDIFLNNVVRGRDSLIRHDGTTFVPCSYRLCFDSRLYFLVYRTIKDLRLGHSHKDAIRASRDRSLDAETEARLDRAARIWSRNVDMMHGVARVGGARYLVFLQPTMGLGRSRAEVEAAAAREPGNTRLQELVTPLLDADYLERTNYLYRRLSAACAMKDFCVDISTEAHLPFDPSVYADPRHPSSEGNRRIAELVAERILALDPRASGAQQAQDDLDVEGEAGFQGR